MISGLGLASKHGSEVEFEFRVEIMIEVYRYDCGYCLSFRAQAPMSIYIEFESKGLKKLRLLVPKAFKFTI